MKTSLLCAIVLIATRWRADRNTDISPNLAKPGDVMFEDSFERVELGEIWASNGESDDGREIPEVSSNSWRASRVC